MSVRIEFFGIARQQAGCESLNVQAGTVGQALDAARAALPGLEQCYRSGQGLRTGFILNLNGQRFLRDLTTPVVAGDSLLLLSADAGG